MLGAHDHLYGEVLLGTERQGRGEAAAVRLRLLHLHLLVCWRGLAQHDMLRMHVREHVSAASMWRRMSGCMLDMQRASASHTCEVISSCDWENNICGAAGWDGGRSAAERIGDCDRTICCLAKALRNLHAALSQLHDACKTVHSILAACRPLLELQVFPRSELYKQWLKRPMHAPEGRSCGPLEVAQRCWLLPMLLVDRLTSETGCCLVHAVQGLLAERRRLPHRHDGCLAGQQALAL